jgi:hypothetical protein
MNHSSYLAMMIPGVLILDFMSVFFFISLFGFMTKFSKRFIMFAHSGN